MKRYPPRTHLWLMAAGVCLAVFSAAGQSLRAYEAAADKHYRVNDFGRALAYYNVVLDVRKNNPKALFFGAESACRLGAYRVAESYFGRIPAAEKLKPVFRDTDFKLAETKRALGKYGEAIALYDAYLTQHPDGAFASEARAHRQHAVWASTYVSANFASQQVAQMGASTYAADVSARRVGDAVYFVSMRFDPDALRNVSVIKRLDKSGTATEFEIPLSDKALYINDFQMLGGGVAAVCSVCRDSAQMKICRIATTQKTGTAWSVPVPMAGFVQDAGASYLMPSLHRDAETGREVMYFVSNKTGGKGGYDVWRSVRLDAQAWSKPVNLSDVNSVGDEVSPFFDGVSKVLYFSSNHFDNFGGFDVFSAAAAGTGFTEPQNMGNIVNSGYDDTWFAIAEGGHAAYFSSNRPGSKCPEPQKDCHCPDVYEMPFKAVLDLETLNKITHAPLPETHIILHDLTDNSRDTVAFSGLSNRLALPLDFGHDYVAVAHRDRYAADTLRFHTRHLSGNTVISRQSLLLPLADLELRVYDVFTGLLLDSVQVQLRRNQSPELVELFSPAADTFRRSLQTGDLLTADVHRRGFWDQFLRIEADNITEPTTLVREVWLERNHFLPLAIYFDNDVPTTTQTDLHYDRAFRAYYARKTAFAAAYCAPLFGDERAAAAQEVEAFFDDDVARNAMIVSEMCDTLYRYLRMGYSLEVVFEGYASPKAGTQYNHLLSQRRVDCVQRYFAAWEGGKMRPYLTNGRLHLVLEAHGEALAAANVSDDDRDLRASVFSPAASRERRVSIIDIRRVPGKLTLRK